MSKCIKKLLEGIANWIRKCLPKYEPSAWNDHNGIQYYNNCYNYACDIKTGTRAQPGKASGITLTNADYHCDGPSGPVWDAAVADGRFTTLVAAVQEAGLVEVLKGVGPFTVFAPTDDAFGLLPEGTVEALLGDIPTLTKILAYHVTDGKLMSGDVVQLESISTLSGDPLSVKVDGDKVMINDSQVVIADVETSNGVIHVIDAVLLPPSS